MKLVPYDQQISLAYGVVLVAWPCGVFLFVYKGLEWHSLSFSFSATPPAHALPLLQLSNGMSLWSITIEGAHGKDPRYSFFICFVFSLLGFFSSRFRGDLWQQPASQWPELSIANWMNWSDAWETRRESETWWFGASRD